MLSNFGGNGIQKAPLTANWTRPTALSNFGCPQNFFIQIFLNWTASNPITV